METRKNDAILKVLDDVLSCYDIRYYSGENCTRVLFKNPLVAEHFNNQYKEITGKNHPKYERNNITFCEFFISDAMKDIYDYLYTAYGKKDYDVEEAFKQVEEVKRIMKKHLDTCPDSEWRTSYLRIAEPYSKTSDRILPAAPRYGIPFEKQYDLSTYKNGDKDLVKESVKI